MWWHNGTPEQDHLNTYWDAVVSGASPEAPAQADPGLDPNYREAIARVRALHTRRRPDPAFALHLERTLMNAFATSSIAAPVDRPIRPKRIVTRPAWLPERELLFPRKWSLAAVATVALIAITLAIFFFSLRGSDQPAIVPATPVDAPTSTPAPALTATVVPVSMYRGGLERTGVMPGPAPTGRPGVLWRAETGNVVNGAVAVGNGLVFAGTDDGSVHAFDMATGAEVWTLTGTTGIESPSIVLDGATAYILGYEGMGLAVDAATGTELWRTDPALNVGRRVAFDAASQSLYVGGLDAVTYAFDSATGALKWQVDTSGPQRSVATIVTGDTLYFGTADGLLYALNTADGSTRWTWDSQFDLVRSLTYANGTIFGPVTSTADFAFVAIDAITGAEKWRLSSTEGEFQAASVVDGNVIIGTAFGEVMSVSQTDGQVNWTFASGTGGGFTAPSGIVGDNVYLIDSDGSLYALNLATGQELWRVKLDGGGNYDPVITGGVIYLGTLEGSVYALGDGGTELPAATPVATPESAGAASPAAEGSPGVVDGQMTLLWETTGEDGGLARPSSVTTAPDGTIWVADADNGRFQIFDVDGTFLESWTGTGDGQFGLTEADGDPYGAVAFAPDGSFYVLDPGARQVLVFAADRTYLRGIGEPGRGAGQFLEPLSIATDAAGNVAVLDDIRGEIQTFAPDGTLLTTTQLRSTYTGPSSMNLMVIDSDGNFLVAELAPDPSLAPVIEKFDPEGNLLQTFGDSSGPGSFGKSWKGQYGDQPIGLAIDAVGNVYITEIGTKTRVVVFSSEASYLMEFGGAGSSTIAFEFPWDVAVDDRGNIYVTDMVQNRLVKLRLAEPLASVASDAASPAPNAASDDVALLWEVSGGDSGLGTIALAPDGAVWVADVVSHGFQIFDTEGNFLESWTGTGDGEFRFMRANGDAFNGITFAADGSFYVLDPDGRRIQAFAADRTFLRSIGGPGREPGQFLEPIDMVIDPAGNLAVLDDVRRDIQTFAPDGTLVSTVLLQAAVPSGPNMNSLAIDAEGNFYVAELTEDADRLRLVEKFDAEGNLLRQFGLAEGPGQLISHPFGIAIDQAGNLYVSEGDPNARVVIFAADGEYLTEFGGAGSTAITFVSHGDFVLDGQGNAYATDWGTNRLVKLRLPQSLASTTPTP